MTDPQRVDLERLTELLHAALQGVTAYASGCVSYPPETAHLSVSFLAKHGPALLQQLAERDAEIEELTSLCDSSREQREGAERALDAAVDRAHAAERAREEVVELLREVERRGWNTQIAETIAAFLAANGGRDETK